VLDVVRAPKHATQKPASTVTNHTARIHAQLSWHLQVLGGLVLTRCSVPFLEGAFGPGWVRVAPVKLLDLLTEFPRSPEEEVVVVAECQPLPCVDGYQAGAVQYRRVLQLNKTPVLNMRHLAGLVSEHTGEFLRLDLEGGMVVVLQAGQAKRDTKALCKAYEVSAAFSS
jgi:hypothetical protein